MHRELADLRRRQAEFRGERADLLADQPVGRLPALVETMPDERAEAALAMIRANLAGAGLDGGRQAADGSGSRAFNGDR